ncbi:C2 family cysteine protease [Brachybacterium sp. DNPG3]
MDFLGADTEQLLEHAQALRRCGERVHEIQQALDPLVAGAAWTGPDAEAFRESWTVCSSRLLDLAGQLGSGAESTALEAAQQDAASDPEGAIDPSAYDGLIGGEGWSDAINLFEGAGDLFRDRVDVDTIGGSWAQSHPGWAPEDVGISEQDIRDAVIQQGNLGDCWYLSALLAAQQTDPGQLADNITGLGSPPGADGWEVRLFVDGEWQGVAVAPEDIGSTGAREAGARWSDAEPGFMSIYESALINATDGLPSAISADSPAAGIEMITGRETRESALDAQPTFEEYRAAIDAGLPITVMTDPILPIGARGDELVSAHVYQVSGYDESTGEIILTNPHGPNASSQYEVRIDPDGWTYANDIVMTGIGE